jgi:hypothetical protein
MIEGEAISLIQTVGFPIFVVIWFMFRTEKVLKANTEAILNLTKLIGDKLNDK